MERLLFQFKWLEESQYTVCGYTVCVWGNHVERQYFITFSFWFSALPENFPPFFSQIINESLPGIFLNHFPSWVH